ncbi:MAG: hypothetical protein AB2792_23040 [Candidatus Thiodiazotropha sp.]
MTVNKRQTETYVLTELDRIDPVTVYVTNYQPGQGKVVIECYGEAWTAYWGAMGDNTLQQFFVTCDNDYILNKMLKNTMQTDFDAINDIAHKKGFEHLCATSDVEVAMQADDMRECFGPDWYMNLPTCNTTEYKYLGRILNAVKGAFTEELQQAA